MIFRVLFNHIVNQVKVFTDKERAYMLACRENFIGSALADDVTHKRKIIIG